MRLCDFLSVHAVYPCFDYNEDCDAIYVSETSRPVQSKVELRRRKFSELFEQSPSLCKTTLRDTGDDVLLRLAWVTLHKDPIPWKLDIKNSDLNLILESFNITPGYRYTFSAPGGIAFIPAQAQEDPQDLVCSVFILDMFAIIWNHDFTTHRTSALCWGDQWVIETMHSLLTHLKPLSQHPIFPALLAATLLGRLLERVLNRLVNSIEAVENRTQFHSRRHTATGIADGSYASLSAQMSGCASTLAGMERITRVFHMILDSILNYEPRRHGIETYEEIELVSGEVNVCACVLRDRLAMEEVQIRFLSRRVDIQLTALFNLIAQKESQISIAVAEDSRTLASASREDSSAMKTIAAVTVVFLPGTFVAAFFAMPLFHWNVDSSSAIMSEYFWIYWAVTVPLTIVTVIVWIIWTRTRGSRHRTQDKEGKEKLWSDINGIEDEAGERKSV